MTATLSTAPEETGPPRRLPLWGLVLVSFSGTLGMHIFVPALPMAGADLGASAASMQLTISLYILGLALGQLLYGPVSDRYGRRPPLLAGLALYAAAGILAASTTGVAALIAARIFQAVGGCAGLVLARAMVRDTCPPREAAGQLAALNMIVTIGPALAPLIGGLLATWLGWRAIFGLLAALGLLCMAVTLWAMPETHPRTGVPGHRGGGFLSANRALLADPRFRLLALGGSCATTALYGIVATAPFILTHDLGQPTAMLGLALGIVILGFSSGNLALRRLLRVASMPRLLLVSTALSSLAALTSLAIALWVPLTLPLYLAPLFVFTFCAGLTGPVSTTAAMSLQPGLTGAASGLYGCIQMGYGAAATLIVGLGSNPAIATALFLSASAIVAHLCYRRVLRSGGIPG